MPPKDDDQSLTLGLLRRAHSPDSVNRIYSDKIQHRPLFLKPSSPPPSNARDARRKARQEKDKRAKSLKPKPLSARERRRRHLYDLPKEGQSYAVFAPLNNLWGGYIREILGSELYHAGQGAAAKLSAADFHGAEVEVSRSRCPSRVGVRGIVVKDTRFTFEVITVQNQVKILPKEGTMFRVHVPAPRVDVKVDTETEKKKMFCFEIHGDQFQHRASDRANKKLKQHFLKKL